MATAPKPDAIAPVRPIIIVRKVKKVAGGHHGGAWKVAYADFVTAMMAFFMLLWLISNPDKQRLKGLAAYFTPVPPNPGSSGAEAGAGASKARADSMKTAGRATADAAAAGAVRRGTANVPDASMRVLAQELRVAIDSVPDEDASPATRLETTRDGLRISLMDTARRSMFLSGTARLNDYGREMLGRVAGKLMKSGASIAIEGHTDGTGGQSAANWKLSGERALAAHGAMLAAGLTPDRFAEIVAMAATRPVYPDQPERPENRRITVVVMGDAPTLPTDVSFRF